MAIDLEEYSHVTWDWSLRDEGMLLRLSYEGFIDTWGVLAIENLAIAPADSYDVRDARSSEISPISAQL